MPSWAKLIHHSEASEDSGEKPPGGPHLCPQAGHSCPSQVTSAASSLLYLQNYFESYLTVASTVSSVLCLMANFLLVNR